MNVMMENYCIKYRSFGMYKENPVLEETCLRYFEQ